MLFRIAAVILAGGTLAAASQGAQPREPFTLALTGDSIINQRLAVFKEPEFTRLFDIIRGADAEIPAEVRRLAPPDVTTVLSSAAWADFDVPANPYFVLIGPGGTVAGEGAAPGWPALLNLLERAEVDGTLPTGRPIRRRGRNNRLDRSDELLARAGVGPGHESLSPPTAGDSV